MGSRPDFSYIAKLMADSSRAAMLDALLGLDGLPASELARKANISLQTASSHLTKLAEGNLVSVEKHGRHRYFRLASTDVAQAIETLTVIAPPTRINSLKDSSSVEKIKIARTCYDHLAGKLGVSITEAFLEKGYLLEDQEDFLVTDKGEKFFNHFEIDIDVLRKKRRHFARKCLDWSERRYHLAGALGNAVLVRLFDLCWIEKLPDRAVKVTKRGKAGLYETLGINDNYL
ncbi:ArsR family transcriptional regulator [Niallia circulans]|uniref:ArsR/SmtB family transcription factor n=1 Tax=Shouchella clausii TaxID=79880 RepID=UPI000BA550AB|nr:helix-turn-helix domain-containing protein [Shouchella clausii]MCM3549897.1 helix-turn-helix domain-containing protein [Shouchella clausii]PAF14936.1 transcriptional regulator [Shouchella clausii]SPU20984.1 ArsR family transcriptional regulator [Niallia circulans]